MENTQEKKKENNGFNLSKWKLQNVAADILGSDWGTHSCLRGQLGGETCVHVNNSTGKAHFSGLKTCGSVWVCPICSVKVSTRRRDEITNAMNSHEGSKLYQVLVTYTLQHNRKDKLPKLINDLKDATRYMLNGRFRKEFYNQFNVAGYIRSVETRYRSKTGWHPHIHELLLLKTPPNPEGIKEFLMGRYGKRLESKGYLVNEHTIDVRIKNADTSEIVSDYLTKSSIELELTSGNWKKGKSVSPFQLLSLYHETGNEWFAALYREYAEATRGKKWITWSRGLRDLLLEDEEEEEDEEIADHDEEGDIVARLTKSQWNRICYRKLRVQVLLHAQDGDLQKWLVKNGLSNPQKTTGA